MADGEVGERLSVELHLLLVQRIDEYAVGHPERFDRVSDTNDPEIPEGSFFVAAVDVSVGSRLHYRVLYAGEDVSVHVFVSLCLGNETLVPFV